MHGKIADSFALKQVVAHSVYPIYPTGSLLQELSRLQRVRAAVVWVESHPGIFVDEFLHRSKAAQFIAEMENASAG